MHTEMKIGIKLEQIDWTHRTGSLKKDDLNKKSTLITVKFVRYTDRRNILSKLLNQRRNDDIERSKGNLVLNNMVLSKCGPLVKRCYWKNMIVQALKCPTTMRHLLSSECYVCMRCITFICISGLRMEIFYFWKYYSS